MRDRTIKTLHKLCWSYTKNKDYSDADAIIGKLGSYLTYKSVVEIMTRTNLEPWTVMKIL